MTYKEWEKKFVNDEEESLTNDIDTTKKDLNTNKNDSIIKVEEHSEPFKNIMKHMNADKVEYNEVRRFDKQPTEQEIINRLSGGDLTEGSCSSLAFAYCGNKSGIDVLDFRGGHSRYHFSMNMNIKEIAKLPGVESQIIEVKKELSGAIKALNDLEIGKEFYFATGKHAAIVRRTENGVEYLELQSNDKSGWTPFEGNERYKTMGVTLAKRFGCRKSQRKLMNIAFNSELVLMKVDSFKNCPEFEELLGYINTSPEKQKKGVKGNVK